MKLEVTTLIQPPKERVSALVSRNFCCVMFSGRTQNTTLALVRSGFLVFGSLLGLFHERLLAGDQVLAFCGIANSQAVLMRSEIKIPRSATCMQKSSPRSASNTAWFTSWVFWTILYDACPYFCGSWRGLSFPELSLLSLIFAAGVVVAALVGVVMVG